MFIALLLAGSAFAASEPAAFFSDLDLFRQRSLALRSDQQSFSAARSLSLSRLLQFTPRFSAGFGREWNTLSGPPQAGVYDTRDTYWRVSADWNVFKSGGDYFSWRSAKQAEKAQGFSVTASALNVETTGSTVIFRRLFLLDSQKAQAELLGLKREALRIGRGRYDQGKISLQDVVKMEVDLSQQENVVRQAEMDLAENEANYRSFFVDDLKTSDWPFEGAKEPLAETQTDAVSFQQLALRAHSDSYTEAWKSSLTRHGPSLDLNLSRKQFPLEASQQSKFWAATLELSIPLWSRWEIASDNAQAYAASVRADDEASQNARDETLRRDFLRKKVNLARANLKEAAANLARADQLYRDMVRSFGLGRLSTNDLFLEQDRKIRTILSYAQARLDFHTSLMEVCALRGLAAVECLK